MRLLIGRIINWFLLPAVQERSAAVRDGKRRALGMEPIIQAPPSFWRRISHGR